MVFTKEDARAMSILDVAQSLGLEMKKSSSHIYEWVEHDSFKIDTRKNTFYWYSRGLGGDTIRLVETIKGVSYKEAMAYLRTGEFPEVKVVEEIKQPFRYQLGRFEQPFDQARAYLKDVRGLSDETIDFFLSKGVLAQARKKAEDNYLEPVIVFKSLDNRGRLIGASYQGIIPSQERYEGKGYLKQIAYNSDGMSGLNIAIGQPRRLVFAEAPIDLMSYYEAYKGTLQDVRLVAMDGLKPATISRYLMENLAEQAGDKTYVFDPKKDSQALEALVKTSTFFHDGKNQDFITLAVDNDKAGRAFVERMQEQGIPVQVDIPPLPEGEKKMDWNDYLKIQKGYKPMEKEKAPDHSQELSNAGDLHRNPDSLGDNTPGTVSKPVEPITQPDFPVITPLQFTTKGERMSTIKQGYHVITEGELSRLNRFAPGLQTTAQWYLKELSNSTISYFYTDNGNLGRLQVQFTDENFAHLTGISPKGIEMKQVVHDFAAGKGEYGNIQVSHAIKDKSMVVPLLQDILSSQAFVFNDLSEVEKLHRIDLAQAIKTEDEDLLLAIRDVDGVGVPASVMRIKQKLSVELAGKEKEILGVYRERDGQIDQLSINETYIKDGGKELQDILERSRSEEVILEENLQAAVEKSLDSDGDGISNEDEIRLGTDPYNAQSVPGKAKQRVEEKRSLSDILEARDMAALSQHMKEGLQAYTNSDQYKLFLQAMSKFHDYSLNNVQLLLMQKPDISLVAGFNKWKEMGRNVEKGQKALKIWQPVIIKQKDENGRPILDENGKEKTVTHFKLGNVFDVSQTQGKELPKPIYNLENGVTDYENLYRAARQVSLDNGIPISFKAIEGGANGYYHTVDREIVLADKKMSEAQIMKTLFHEMAHSDLHFIGDGYSRSERELQAESIAYVVANHYGIDTSEYSFGYLHTWSQDQKGYEDLVNQLQVVQKGAQSLISRIDTKLELIKSKSLGQDKFQSKLAQAKDKSAQVAQEKQAREQDSLSKKPPAPAKEL